MFLEKSKALVGHKCLIRKHLDYNSVEPTTKWFNLKSFPFSISYFIIIAFLFNITVKEDSVQIPKSHYQAYTDTISFSYHNLHAMKKRKKSRYDIRDGRCSKLSGSTIKSGRMNLYWLKSELMAETAAFIRVSGAGKSGNPSARLMALHRWARRESCWIGEGMNFFATEDSFSSMPNPLQKQNITTTDFSNQNFHFIFVAFHFRIVGKHTKIIHSQL